MKIFQTETRAYVVLSRSTSADARGRRTQKTLEARCPFCEAIVRMHLWSLAGGGKLCACGAKFSGDSSCVKSVDTGIRIQKAPGGGLRIQKLSGGGLDPEFEVVAPDGHRFEGPHPLPAREGHSFLARSMRLAQAQARVATLRRCVPGCACGRGGEPSEAKDQAASG